MVAMPEVYPVINFGRNFATRSKTVTAGSSPTSNADIRSWVSRSYSARPALKARPSTRMWRPLPVARTGVHGEKRARGQLAVHTLIRDRQGGQILGPLDVVRGKAPFTELLTLSSGGKLRR
jgi:hypothetical protein